MQLFGNEDTACQPADGFCCNHCALRPAVVAALREMREACAREAYTCMSLCDSWDETVYRLRRLGEQ